VSNSIVAARTASRRSGAGSSGAEVRPEPRLVAEEKLGPSCRSRHPTATLRKRTPKRSRIGFRTIGCLTRDV